MASILDQYEEESNRAASRRPNLSSADPMSSGFIDARFVTEAPIFSKKKINFTPTDPITHMVVSNNFLICAMSNNTSNIFYRLDLDNPDKSHERIELPKGMDDRVHKIFLDPTGRHLIISMTNQESYYLPRNLKKARSIPKLKGHIIQAVGWNWQNASDDTTNAILLGTDKGLIFETELRVNDDNRSFFHGSIEQYAKQLFTLQGKEIPEPVTGLEFDRMPNSEANMMRYYIMATTPGRLYQFIGQVSQSSEPPMFASLFQHYEGGSDHTQFLELPGDVGYSELHLYFPKFRQPAQKFAWMAGPGVYFGDINLEGTAGPSSVLANSKLFQYKKEWEDQVRPMSLILTEFHVLLLYPDGVKAICLLNEQMAYDDKYPERVGRLKGVCKDPLKGTIWSFTTGTVFRYEVTKEDRDVWQMYLEQNKFELAKQYCYENPMHLDKVLTKQAQYLFSNEKYEDSAAMYALTQNSFEEIALKFIKLPNKDALKRFIKSKLSSLKPQDKTQMTMLVTWMIELYLNKLGELKEHSNEMPEYTSTQTEFHHFLKEQRVKECVSQNRSVVYDLISSHGDVVDLVFFAVLMNDFKRVIDHYIQHKNYADALEILTKQTDIQLYYDFSPLLIQNVPGPTITAWMRQGKQLDPKRLIPALVQYDHERYKEQANEAIRYLEFAIQNLDNKDRAIHNYLLSLYASDKAHPEKLMIYLEMQGDDPEDLSYDVKYALRLCAEKGHQRACVHIYSLMGLYEEAVDMALLVDVELAKDQADKPDENDKDMRKKLWLRIARHVVEEEKDIKHAMEFLHDCDRLKIEDILPFFPDFVTIDHFKDAIISSLQEYNQHIDRLQDEMEEATKSAEEIRNEIHSFRNKFAFVKAEDKCSSCNYTLMSRAFYIFPCAHKFHSDCLVAEVLPSLTPTKRAKVEALQRKMAEGGDVRSPEGTSIKELDIKAELDDLVASECILCGDFMVRCVDKLFVEDDEWASLAAEWE